MKRLKYLSIFALIFGAMAFSCNDENIRPLGTGGDDEEDDPIILDPPPPPPPTEQNTVPLDSLNG